MRGAQIQWTYFIVVSIILCPFFVGSNREGKDRFSIIPYCFSIVYVWDILIQSLFFLDPVCQM